MPSAISCKLNKNFKDTLRLKSYNAKGQTLIIDQTAADNAEIYHAWSPGTLEVEPVAHENCCGISELSFENFYDYCRYTKLPYSEFLGITANYIKLAICDTSDKRMVFVGIPTKVGLNSQYRGNFYPRLRKVLRNFGFVETCKPYKNQNSGNKIIMMVGQIP